MVVSDTSTTTMPSPIPWDQCWDESNNQSKTAEVAAEIAKKNNHSVEDKDAPDDEASSSSNLLQTARNIALRRKEAPRPPPPPPGPPPTKTHIMIKKEEEEKTKKNLSSLPPPPPPPGPPPSKSNNSAMKKEDGEKSTSTPETPNYKITISTSSSSSSSSSSSTPVPAEPSPTSVMDKDVFNTIVNNDSETKTSSTTLKDGVMKVLKKDLFSAFDTVNTDGNHSVEEEKTGDDDDDDHESDDDSSYDDDESEDSDRSDMIEKYRYRCIKLAPTTSTISTVSTTDRSSSFDSDCTEIKNNLSSRKHERISKNAATILREIEDEITEQERQKRQEDIMNYRKAMLKQKQQQVLQKAKERKGNNHNNGTSVDNMYSISTIEEEAEALFKENDNNKGANTSSNPQDVLLKSLWELKRKNNNANIFNIVKETSKWLESKYNSNENAENNSGGADAKNNVFDGDDDSEMKVPWFSCTT